MKTFTWTTRAALVTLMASLTSTAWAEGDLSVRLDSGVLYIVGDKAANEVIVAQYDDPETPEIDEKILVGGRPGGYGEFWPWIPLVNWTGYTTVNGGGPEFFPGDEVSEVVVTGGKGDDDILLRGNLDVDVLIDGGPGEDRIYTYSSTVIDGNLSVNSGLNADKVSITVSSVAGSTEISTGHGEDDVFLSGSFLGNVTINTGVHADLFGSRGSVFLGNLTVEMGQGDDSDP